MSLNENKNRTLTEGDEDRVYPEGIAEEIKQADSGIKPFASQVKEW